MRTILLVLIGITFFNQTNAQNWEFEGIQQFTDFASDVAITHNATGETYIAYANVLDVNKVYVMKFNGTNWINVGSVASAVSASLLSIAINPIDGNPWVAFKDISTNLNLKIVKFNGVAWSVDGDIAFGAAANAPARKTQLSFDTNGNAFVVTTNDSYANQALIFYSNRTGSWVSQFSETVSGNAELVNANEFFFNVRDYPTGTKTYKRVFNGTSWGSAVLVRDAKNVGYSPKSISVASGTDFLIQREDSNDQIYHTENAPVTYTATIVSNNSFGYFMNYKNNPVNNKNYVFYLDNTLKGILKIKNGTSWDLQTSSSIDLSGLPNNQFAKMNINPSNGKIYVAYNDAGKVSVKYYNLPPDLPRIYVNKNAVGSGDGSSWANAYSNLSEALLVGIGSTTTELWIASGTYIPHASDRTANFTIANPDISIYGGFTGIETALNQRDFRTNRTILSGDLLGNDDMVYNYFNVTRDDNTFNLVKINANNVVLDGLTISDGHARTITTGSVNSGAGLTKLNSVSNLEIRNCIFENNVSFETGSGILAPFNEDGSLIIENCEFKNNVAKGGSSLYSFTEANKTANIKVNNSLFTNNKAMNLNVGNSLGYSGSVAWIRAYGASSSIDATFVNNTFVDNLDSGTSTVVTNRATLCLDQEVATSVMNAKVYNCIFWNNKDINNTTAKAIRNARGSFPNTMIVTNSLDSDDFSTVLIKQNIITTDPLFVSTTDFQLNSGSPAINSGDNTKVPSALLVDLLGNQRIYNTTVDMGAYEFDAALSSEYFTSFTEFEVYPNPTSSLLNITSNDEIKSMTIYSLDGKLILDTKENKVDVSNLQNGLYIIKVTTDQNGVGTKKFVKR